jgi:ABC-2 type transport system ATP-binding protein
MLARAIVHRPRLLFLDEPTTGLDPQARVAVWQLVDGLRAAAVSWATDVPDARCDDDLGPSP